MTLELVQRPVELDDLSWTTRRERRKVPGGNTKDRKRTHRLALQMAKRNMESVCGKTVFLREGREGYIRFVRLASLDFEERLY